MRLRSKQQLDKYLGNFLIAIHLVAAKTLGWILRRNHSLNPPPQNIIFIKIMGIGSVLMAADGIMAIRARYTGTRLILLANRSVINGIRPTSLFDEYWEYDDNSFSLAFISTMKNLMRAWKTKGKWISNLEVYSKLTTIFSLWTCARNRFDFFFNEVSFRKNINTHPVYFNQFSLAHENYDRMANAMGATIERKFEMPGLPIDQREHRSKKYIVINNTCSELARERLYPNQLLAQLCRELFTRYQAPILLSGTLGDRDDLERMIKETGLSDLPITNIAGQHSIESFIALLYNECRLLITVDSAPLHYAYRLGVPLVALWGPTHPVTRMIESTSSRAIYLAVRCSPCTHHTSVLPCGGDNICMKHMEVSLVMGKVEEVMNSTSK
ncbi:MAG: hypothetical protein H7Y42_04705 [Chitinophagaceae bacterium]|nr:hypothetical protein [Chitinophagaceae bacterium]